MELSQRSGKDRAQIARWERDGVVPSFESLLEIVRACGFDISLDLVSLDGLALLAMDETRALTPKERLDLMLERRLRTPGAQVAADATDPFDPRAILAVLERRRVTYVAIGALARVLHGTEEVTDDLDICPRVAPDNAERLAGALEELGVAGASDRAIFESLGEGTITALETSHGRLQLVPRPAGTRHGWGDLRRQANYEAIGDGLRVPVASLNDLMRMAAALDRDDHTAARLQMRSLRELTHDLGMER